MMARGMAMARIEGEGERAARLRRRRTYTIIGLLGLTGGIVGGALGGATGQFSRFLTDPDATISPTLAIAAAAVTVIGTIVGAIAYFRHIDELERQVNYWTANITVNFYFLTYIAWFILWKGSLLPEPSHETLFGSTFVVMILAYYWKKLRP
jgi:hypothetical protein